MKVIVVVATLTQLSALAMAKPALVETLEAHLGPGVRVEILMNGRKLANRQRRGARQSRATDPTAEA